MRSRRAPCRRRTTTEALPEPGTEAHGTSARTTLGHLRRAALLRFVVGHESRRRRARDLSRRPPSRRACTVATCADAQTRKIVDCSNHAIAAARSIGPRRLDVPDGRGPVLSQRLSRRMPRPWWSHGSHTTCAPSGRRAASSTSADPLPGRTRSPGARASQLARFHRVVID